MKTDLTLALTGKAASATFKVSETLMRLRGETERLRGCSELAAVLAPRTARRSRPRRFISDARTAVKKTQRLVSCGT